MVNISHTPQQPALKALERFQKSEHLGVWPNYDKIKILTEIRQYIPRHDVIQADYPLSKMVRDDPCRFVKICHSIFETGGVQNSYGRFQAPAQLCTVSSPPLHCQQVEALIMKTLLHAAVILPSPWLSMFLNVEALRSRHRSYPPTQWVDQVFLFGRIYFLFSAPPSRQLVSWHLNRSKIIQ